MTIYTSPQSFMDPTPSTSQKISQSLGTGIGTGLRLLMEAKLKGMGKNQEDPAATMRRLQEGSKAFMNSSGGVQQQQSGMDMLGQQQSGGVQQQQSGMDMLGQQQSEIDTDKQKPQDGSIESFVKQEQALSGPGPNYQGVDISKITNDQLFKEKSMYPKGEFVQFIDKKLTEYNKKENEAALPSIIEQNKSIKQLPIKENTLRSMKQAVKEGNLGYFTLDKLADLTGVEAFRTPHGAAFKNAVKEFFLSSIGRAGARPNQWIEKQIQKMLPLIGQSEEANLMVIALLESENRMARMSNEAFDNIRGYYNSVYSRDPANIDSLVTKRLENQANREQDRLEKDLREIASSEKIDISLAKEGGEQLSDELAQKFLNKHNNNREEARKDARDHGYTF